MPPTRNNAYRQGVLENGALVEVWAGGPCVVTGKFCPVWRVLRADGTGVQSRGASRPETPQEAADLAWTIALETAR